MGESKVGKKFFPEVTTFVTHLKMDLDALVSLWLLSRFAENWDPKRVQLVPAGNILTGSEEDPTVIHVDTGGGQFDHHNTNARISSAHLLAEYFEILDDPAYAVLIEASIKADHAEEVAPTDLRYIIGADLHLHHRGKLGLQDLLKESFKLFEKISSTQVAWAESARKFERKARWEGIEGSTLRLCIIEDGTTGMQAEAFRRGADVVLTSTRYRGQRYTAVLASNQGSLRLEPVVARLRAVEKTIREGNVETEEAKDQAMEVWYFHPSGKMVLNGSPKHPLDEGEQTRIDFGMIKFLVGEGMKAMSAGS